MKTCVSFVTYNIYGRYDWTKICVRSYRNVFADEVPLTVVDHNHNPDEVKFLEDNQVTVIETKSGSRTHGAGLDTATEYARQAGYDAIVFIEPDCVINHIQWYQNILSALESGKSMASTIRLSYGPLHPCSSGWIIKDIPTSFEACNKTEQDIFHPAFKEAMSFTNLSKVMSDHKFGDQGYYFFFYHWDTGMKNWFLLRTQNKDQFVVGKGFNHFWESHRVTPQMLLERHPNLKDMIWPFFDKPISYL